jgi:hypothetical protein
MSVLTPSLCICIISEYFRREGNIPVDRDLLNMYVYANGDDINAALAFMSLIVSPSYPQADLGFMDIISLLLVLIPISEMVVKMRYINNLWVSYLFLYPYLSAHLKY